MFHEVGLCFLFRCTDKETEAWQEGYVCGDLVNSFPTRLMAHSGIKLEGRTVLWILMLA